MLRTSRFGSLGLVIGWSLALAAMGASQRAVQDGVSVELDVHTEDAGTAFSRATLRVTDAASGTPIDGAKPRVWFSQRRNEQVERESSCLEKIARFAGGQLTARADADLNRYVIATLNHDRTVTFLDPFVASTYKLQAAVELRANGFDWLYAPTLERIFLSMPDGAALAVIDAATLKLVGNVELPGPGKPGRLGLSEDGRTIWVSMDGSNRVAAVDGAAAAVKAFVPVGDGLHNFASAPLTHTMYVTNSASASVTAVDGRTLQPAATIAVGATPIAATWVPAAQAIYVGSLNADFVAGIDPVTNTVRFRIPVGRGVVAVAADPGGRHMLALNQFTAKLIMIDSAVNRVVASATTPAEPDQVAFTGRYAYVRSLESDSVTLVDLADMHAGKAAPLMVQMTGKKPSEEVADVSAAPMIAATPEGNSVVMASAPDAAIYFYEEGQMASKGNLQNYRRRPRGVLVLDRSLQAVAKGVYSAPLQIAAGGRFDVAVAVDNPRVRLCFEVTLPKALSANTRPGVTRWTAAPLAKTLSATPGTPVTVAFRVTSESAALAHGPVQILAFQPPGTWQQRQWASIGPDGIVTAVQVFPHSGKFTVQLLSAAPGIQLQSVPVFIDAAEPAPPTEVSQK